MIEFEPMRVDDCLKLVDIIRMAMSAHRTTDGCISPNGAKVITAVIEGLEMKLGAERRGPRSVK